MTGRGVAAESFGLGLTVLVGTRLRFSGDI